MTKLTYIGGRPVTDAKRPIKLTVTAEDIKLADKKNPSQCAIAQACYRQTTVQEARIHLTRAYLLTNGKWRRYATPTAIRTEIIAFDRGGNFQPIEFKFGVVAKRDRLGTPRRGGSVSGKLGKRRTSHVVTDVRSSPVVTRV